MPTGRPRSFEKSAVLDTIMQVFWAKGFESTTKRDLMDATGLASQSLYNTFGDKQAMFQEALDHYAHTREEELRAILDSGETPLAGLRNFISLLADMPEDFRKGCLLCNACAQMNPSDEDPIAEFVRDKLALMRQLFLECLEDGKRRGELSSTADAPAIASALVSTANGIALLYRIDASAELIHDAARGALQLIASKHK